MKAQVEMGANKTNSADAKSHKAESNLKEIGF